MVTWRQRLRDLLCVKSIVTILLTVVFVALTLAGRVSSQEFLTIFSVVIAFYFGSQSERAKHRECGKPSPSSPSPKEDRKDGRQRRGRIPDRIKATHKTGGNPAWT